MGTAIKQHFNSAFVALSADGTADLVMLNDELAERSHHNPRRPLQPIEPSPLRQVMHIRIFWNETQSHVIREASLSNASIEWTLFGNTRAPSADLLRYTGAGYARLDPHATGGRQMRIDLRQIRLQAALVQGGLRDALGPTTINGIVYAKHDDAQVSEILKLLNDQSAHEGSATSVPMSLRP